MIIRERSAGAVRVLDIEGPITISDGAETLRIHVRGLLDHGHTLLVANLARVPYVDSASLGELAYASTVAKRQGGGLKLLNVAPQMRHLLIMTKLHTVIETFEDEDAAVKSFG